MAGETEAEAASQDNRSEDSTAGPEVWPVLSCLPGAGQQVGSDRPGQEKQGERETASQNAPSLSWLAPPITDRTSACASLPHAVQKGTAELRVVQPLTKFTQPV